MAYTKAPETQTHTTERVPGFTHYSGDPGSGSNFFSAMVNLIGVFSDTNGGTTSNESEICSETREPIKANQVSATTTDVARGCYVWEKTSGTVYYFAVFGDKVYTSTTGLEGSWTNVQTLTTTTGSVGFTEFITSTSIKYLILVDGAKGYRFADNTAPFTIVDADFPTPHLPFPVFLDGYLFLAKANTGDIYNSDLNDPTAWTAGSFISSELYPDDLTAIIKINNYLLAIGKFGCEYFYDAANATGTPLARQEGASLPFGCPVPTSIASNKDTVIMLCNASDGIYSLKLIEGLKYKDITPDWFASLVSSTFRTGNVYPASGFRAYFIRHKGQLCYVCLFTGSTMTQRAFARLYTTKTKCWSVLEYDTGMAFPATYSAFGSSSNVITYLQGNTISATAGLPFFGTYGLYASGQTIQDDLNVGGALYKYSITNKLFTPWYDFGTMNVKYMSRLGIFYDAASGDVPMGGLTIAVNDTPFATGEGSWGSTQTFPTYTSLNDYFPFVTQLGRFRRRSFLITYTGIIRLKYMEVDINKGQQ